MTKRKIAYWVIPPECDAEFVAHMEEVQKRAQCRTVPLDTRVQIGVDVEICVDV